MIPHAQTSARQEAKVRPAASRIITICFTMAGSMNGFCKYCGGRLDIPTGTCPRCGAEHVPEGWWKSPNVLAFYVCVAVLVVLSWWLGLR
jgi:hypothetical protein